MGTVLNGKILNGRYPEWTQSQMDTIPNGYDPEWTPPQMDTITNGHNYEWAQLRMGTITIGTITNEHLHVYSYLGVLYVLLGKNSFIKTMI